MTQKLAVRNGMGNYQAGTGAKEDDLQFLSNELIYQEGVILTGDLLVSQHAAGADMSVDVAPGRAFIKNDSWTVNTAGTTKYWEYLNDAVANLVITANSSGSTRVDLVVVTVDTVTTPNGDASNIVAAAIVVGTPGAGAPATPSNSFKIAEVSIASGATSIVDANITSYRVCCGTQDLAGLFAYVPNIDGGYIEVYANQIYASEANPETFNLVRLIVPSGYANVGTLNAAVDAAGNATRVCDVELMPGSHFLSSKLSLSTSHSNMSIYGHGPATEILAISSGYTDTSVIYINGTDRLSIHDLSVGVSTTAGTVYGIEFNGACDGLNIDIFQSSNGAGDTGDRFLFKSDATTAKRWHIVLRMYANAAPFSLDYITGCQITAIGGQTTTSGWSLGVNSSYNIVHVNNDVAGTDAGTGNSVTSVVF